MCKSKKMHNTESPTKCQLSSNFNKKYVVTHYNPLGDGIDSE